MMHRPSGNQIMGSAASMKGPGQVGQGHAAANSGRLLPLRKQTSMNVASSVQQGPASPQRGTESGMCQLYSARPPQSSTMSTPENLKFQQSRAEESTEATPMKQGFLPPVNHPVTTIKVTSKTRDKRSKGRNIELGTGSLSPVASTKDKTHKEQSVPVDRRVFDSSLVSRSKHTSDAEQDVRIHESKQSTTCGCGKETLSIRNQSIIPTWVVQAIWQLLLLNQHATYIDQMGILPCYHHSKMFIYTWPWWWLWHVYLSDKYILYRLATVVWSFWQTTRQTLRWFPNLLKRSGKLPPKDSGTSSKKKKISPQMLKCPLGFTGLDNVGNTCYMNSTLQVLANTTKLRDYFLDNGSNGTRQQFRHGISSCFGQLIGDLWSQRYSSVQPTQLKSHLAGINKRFSGFSQQDAQECLTVLLNGLHEDLQKHSSKQSSIIHDLFEGELNTSYSCHRCKQVSEVVDPFIVLPVPLKSVKHLPIGQIPVYFMSNYAQTTPIKFMVEKTQMQTVLDLKSFISKETKVDSDRLHVCEVFERRILRVFEDNDCSLANVTVHDTILVTELMGSNAEVEEDAVYNIGVIQRNQIPQAYCDRPPGLCSFCNKRRCGEVRLKPCTRCYMAVFCQECERSEDHFCDENIDRIGYPFFISVPKEKASLSRLRRDIQRQASYSVLIHSYVDPQFSLVPCDRKGGVRQNELELIDRDGSILDLDDVEYLALIWNNKQTKVTSADQLNVQTAPMRTEMEECKPIDLQQCFQFLVEKEVLQDQSQPICPQCGVRSPVTKHTMLQKLPRVLIVQLKRFSAHRFPFAKTNNKVHFPERDLDVSAFIRKDKLPSVPQIYDLQGVIYHRGNRHFGHYTSHARCSSPRDEAVDLGWRLFNDSSVKTDCQFDYVNAYILVYQLKTHTIRETPV